MGMGMSCSLEIWGQFADFIRQKLPNKDRYRIIMDDILIFSKKETHQQDIEDLLDVLIEYGLHISPHKCQMFRDRLVYMGLHFMIREGKPCFEPMKDKCDAIRNMQPHCVLSKNADSFVAWLIFCPLFFQSYINT